MTILESLWYGNIRPVEKCVDDNTEYKNLLRLVGETAKSLNQPYRPNKPSCLRNATPQ